MKTTIRTTIVLITLIALGGCYLALDDGSGEVGIVLPAPRSVNESAPAELARIYVLNGPNLVPVGDGTDYAEFDLSPSDDESLTEATVGPVPSGGGYRVVLVFGNEIDYGTGDVASLGGTGFSPVQYAVSGLFTVNAGQATVTDVNLVPTPFVTLDGADTAGENLIDIVFANGAIFTATPSEVLSTGTTLADLTTVDLSSHTTFSFRTGENTINSLDVGANATEALAFVNTNIGIQALRSNGATISTFDDNMPGKPVNVLSSGGQDGFGVPFDSYGYFQFDGGFGGYRTNGTTPGAAANWMSNVDLSDLVTGEALFDLAVANDGATPASFYGYFATKLGSFRIPETVLDIGTLSSSEIFNDYAEFFRVDIGGNPAVITQIGVRDGGSHIFLGTKRGAIRAPISDLPALTGSVNGAVIDDQAVIAGTVNQEVRDIVVSGSLVVILTDHFVTVSQDDGVTWKSVPTYAGGSGGANGILVDSVSGVVLVAGPEGLSGFQVAGL